MEHLDSMIKLVDNELAAIEANGKFRSREEIDSVYKLIDCVKDIHEIWEMEDNEQEYSNGMMRDGYAYRGGSYNDGGYDRGGSYARGRGRNARRDSMGRYSRNSYRNDGYSRMDKAEYIDNLRMMMEDAPDEATKQHMRRMIDQMNQQ